MRRPAAIGAVAAVLMATLVVALAMTGRWPGESARVRFQPTGIVALAAERIERIGVARGAEHDSFRRVNGRWVVEGAEPGPTADAISTRFENAIRFLNVSTPVRVIEAGDHDGADLAAFGLDPPRQIVALVGGTGVTTVEFGGMNPAQVSQYVRVAGQPRVYLMPRHVGAEWDLAVDMAKRAAHASLAANAGAPGAERRLLLPVPLDRIWAIEVVGGGKLVRFERDGTGKWLHHVGQHVHASAAEGHVADPVQADRIGDELDSFDKVRVEQVIALHPEPDALARYGLDRPPLIVLLYARDDSRAVARVELGAAAAASRLYARVREEGSVVTIAASEATHVARLVEIAGGS